MPNPNAPFGLRPLRRLGGSPYNGGYGYNYKIANALAQNLGFGCLVVRTGTDKNITIGVDGVAGAPAVGVFQGCKYRDLKGNIIHSPNWVSGTATFASEGAKAIVIDDPKVVFLMQMSAGFVAADSGQFAGLVIGAPNSLGISQDQANSADITGTLDNFKILGLYEDQRNAYGTNALVEVLIAFQEYGDGTIRAS